MEGMDRETRTPDEIWHGDLLDHKAEAELLVGFIESVTAQPQLRQDARAFTIAVDAGYGEGKTYFLKRMAAQLSLNHPVAYIDAWRDDLADEPLTALAATLKRALEPLFELRPEIKSKFDVVLEKTGRVAKVAGKGLLKRGLSLLITKEAVEAAGAAMEGATEAVQDAVNDSLKEGGQELVDRAASALINVAPGDLMNLRISEFEDGQRAIDDLKASLDALVKALNRHDTHPPIVVVIDELDRCRPTYAIKLLEEVKHLFDVPGLVFVFGTHSGQLSKSVSGAYGEGFDGRAYLARFFHRQYRLKPPELEGFVHHMIEQFGIIQEHLEFPQVRSGDVSTTSGKIAFHLSCYDLSARDAISVMEDLYTCWVMAGKQALIMPLLLPLVISTLKGEMRGELAEPSKGKGGLRYWFHDFDRKGEEQTWWATTLEFNRLARLPFNEFNELWKGGSQSAIASWITEFRNNSRLTGCPFANPSRYADLIETVGRLTSPAANPPLR
jgi:KAP family P-loop domain